MLAGLKERKRYIVFKVYSDHILSEKKVKDAVESQCLQFLGELGMSKAGLLFIAQSRYSGVVRVSHKYVDEIKTALSMIKKIDGKNVMIKTLRVTGTIKKTKKIEVN